MSATITTIGTVKRRPAWQRATVSEMPVLTNAFTGKLYRYHGMRVLDVSGRKVGIVDWVWSGKAEGVGEFFGLQLVWLRGKARPVPCHGAAVDIEARIVRIPYRKDQIRRAGRCAIDRQLSDGEKRAIRAHYAAPALPATIREAVATAAA